MAVSKYLMKAQGNSSSTTVSSAVSDSATSMPLTSDTAFAGEGMVIVDEGQSTEELAYGTGKVGSSITTLVADRGLEGGSPQAHGSTATVKGILTAGMWNNVITSLSLLINNVTGAIKTVIDMTGVTLTAPTLTSPTLTTPVINTSFSGTAKATATTVAAGTNDDTIVTPLAVAPYGNSSMARQAVMNGNFDVWQRGTTSATIADLAVVYLADRWFDTYVDDGGTLPTLTRTRQLLTSGDISNSYYYSRLTTNGAGTSLGTSSRGGYFHRIENGVRNLCGASKTVTVSFWARSDIANKKIGLYLLQNYGTGGSPSATENIIGTNWTLTSTWTKYTYTFTTNTLASKTFGTSNDDYLGISFYYIWGTNGYDDLVGATTAETFVGSGNIDTAQVQLCAGSVALPFQPKSYGEELRDCQRYCFDLTGGSTTANLTLGTMYMTSATNGHMNLAHPVDMRTAPTVSSFTPSILSTGYSNTANTALTNFAVGLSTKRNTLFTLTAASGWTADRPASLFFNTTVVPILLLAEI